MPKPCLIKHWSSIVAFQNVTLSFCFKLKIRNTCGSSLNSCKDHPITSHTVWRSVTSEIGTGSPSPQPAPAPTSGTAAGSTPRTLSTHFTHPTERSAPSTAACCARLWHFPPGAERDAAWNPPEPAVGQGLRHSTPRQPLCSPPCCQVL